MGWCCFWCCGRKSTPVEQYEEGLVVTSGTLVVLKGVNQTLVPLYENLNAFYAYAENVRIGGNLAEDALTLDRLCLLYYRALQQDATFNCRILVRTGAQVISVESNMDPMKIRFYDAHIEDYLQLSARRVLPYDVVKRSFQCALRFHLNAELSQAIYPEDALPLSAAAKFTNSNPDLLADPQEAAGAALPGAM